MGILRTLLALAIALAHFGQTSVYSPINGDTAVQAFFVMSGFYITMVYNSVYSDYRYAQIIFWTNRYTRLAPLYIIVATLAFLMTGSAAIQDLDPVSFLLLLISHLTLIGQDVWVFLDYNKLTGDFSFLWDIPREITTTVEDSHIPGNSLLLIPQGWSIGVEIWFYMLAPYLVNRSPRVLLMICFSTFFVRFLFYGMTGLDKDPWTYRFFPFELGVFLLGVLSWHLYKVLLRHPRLHKNSAWIFIGVILVTLVYYYIPGGGREKRYLFLVCFAAALPFIFMVTRNWKADRFIGEFSYPLYIVHLLRHDLTLRWSTPSDPLRRDF